MWAEVTTKMMSEEDSEEENIYLRHSPSYQSEILIKFMEKLDMQVETAIKRNTPRIERR